MVRSTIKSFFKILFGWTSTLLVVAIAASYVIFQAWPSSHWLSDVEVQVFDSTPGNDVFMVVDRNINRPFVAEWNVLVRQQAGEGWTIVCTARGKSVYRADSILPDPLTLDWWTDGQCPYVKETGKTFVSTIWTIETRAGNKTVILDSNIFRIDQIENF